MITATTTISSSRELEEKGDEVLISSPYRLWKRRRRNCNIQRDVTVTPTTSTSNDWYDEIYYNSNSSSSSSNNNTEDDYEYELSYETCDGDGNTRDTSCRNCNSEVRSSWLKDVRWISSSTTGASDDSRYNNNTDDEMEYLNDEQEQQQQQQQQDNYQKEQYHEKTYMDDDDDDDDHNHEQDTNDIPPKLLLQLQYEIQHIHQQLIQVKRRLQPAIERHYCNTTTGNNNNKRATTTRTTSKQATTTTTKRNIFYEARQKCNPYEALGKRSTNSTNGSDRRACCSTGIRSCDGLNDIFINRSAIKLANIDAILDFCITTSIPTSNNNGTTDQDNINININTNNTNNNGATLKFVDLCGAPGGFSEYILWRRIQLQLQLQQQSNIQQNQYYSRGYGMSLVGHNEHGCGIPWTLQDTVTPHTTLSNTRSSTQRSFQEQQQEYYQYRICYGIDGTGDVYNWDNVVALQDTICKDDEYIKSVTNTNINTNSYGKVHLVLVDGGFDTQRDSEFQEEVSIKLVVCEAAAALQLLCPGGILLIKVFGFQTPIIRTMMTHLYFMFDSIVAIKPISSRPASAERYVVCYNFRGHLSSQWSGQRWCNDLYLGRPYTPSHSIHDNADTYIEKEARLLRYLDEFDRDILKLNLKASFAILSYIERENVYYLHIGSGGSDSSDDPEHEDDLHFDEIPQINIPMYRTAWCLDG